MTPRLNQEFCREECLTCDDQPPVQNPPVNPTVAPPVQNPPTNPPDNCSCPCMPCIWFPCQPCQSNCPCNHRNGDRNQNNNWNNNNNNNNRNNNNNNWQTLPQWFNEANQAVEEKA